MPCHHAACHVCYFRKPACQQFHGHHVHSGHITWNPSMPKGRHRQESIRQESMTHPGLADTPARACRASRDAIARTAFCNGKTASPTSPCAKHGTATCRSAVICTRSVTSFKAPCALQVDPLASTRRTGERQGLSLGHYSSSNLRFENMESAPGIFASLWCKPLYGAPWR